MQQCVCNALSSLSVCMEQCENAASLLASVREQEMQFERLTRALEEERRSVGPSGTLPRPLPTLQVTPPPTSHVTAGTTSHCAVPHFFFLFFFFFPILFISLCPTSSVFEPCVSIRRPSSRVVISIASSPFQCMMIHLIHYFANLFYNKIPSSICIPIPFSIKHTAIPLILP